MQCREEMQEDKIRSDPILTRGISVDPQAASVPIHAKVQTGQDQEQKQSPSDSAAMRHQVSVQDVSERNQGEIEGL